MAKDNLIFNKAKPTGQEVYYTTSFRDVLETHFPLIIESNRFTNVDVPPIQAHKNENDFYGLLNDLGVDHYLFWPTLRLNGYHEPTEYREDHLSIRMPNPDYLEILRRMHVTIHLIR